MKASTATRNVCLDKAHKLIRTWDATDAAVHDRQKLDDVLDVSNTGKEVWADSVYRSAQIEARLTAKGLQSRIHRRAARNPSAFTAPEVGQHDALESARPCRACLRPAAELDRRQDRAQRLHPAGEVQDRDDEPLLQHTPTGSARARVWTQ
jgi:IS5 family transposase